MAGRHNSEAEQARQFALTLPVILGILAAIFWYGPLWFPQKPKLALGLLIAGPAVCLVAVALPAAFLCAVDEARRGARLGDDPGDPLRVLLLDPVADRIDHAPVRQAAFGSRMEGREELVLERQDLRRVHARALPEAVLTALRGR